LNRRKRADHLRDLFEGKLSEIDHRIAVGWYGEINSRRYAVVAVVIAIIIIIVIILSSSVIDVVFVVFLTRHRMTFCCQNNEIKTRQDNVRTNTESVKKVKERIAVSGIPSHSYGTSLAI